LGKAYTYLRKMAALIVISIDDAKLASAARLDAERVKKMLGSEVQIAEVKTVTDATSALKTFFKDADQRRTHHVLLFGHGTPLDATRDGTVYQNVKSGGLLAFGAEVLTYDAIVMLKPAHVLCKLYHIGCFGFDWEAAQMSTASMRDFNPPKVYALSQSPSEALATGKKYDGSTWFDPEKGFVDFEAWFRQAMKQ